MRSRTWTLCLLCAGACAHEPVADVFATTTTTAGAGDSSGMPDSSGTPDPGSSGAPHEDSSGGHAPLLDVGAGPTTPGIGCEKIDFLFVVDNSSSMVDEQQQLVASFPGFADEIQAVVGVADVHVMVVDTDAASGVTGSCHEAACPGVAACADYCTSDCTPGCDCTCCGTACADIVAPTCADTLGAGKIEDAAGNACGIAGEQRFITEVQPDPAAAFACVAEVGTGGNGFEQPMGAAIAAITSECAPDRCNDGFLRDDAILVVTVITDEDDTGSPGDPAAWYDALVSAKGGDAAAVVPLALIGDSDVPGGSCPPGDIDDGASPAPRLRSWAESFPFGAWDSVCAPDFVGFFTAAVAKIDASCDDFEPEG